MKNKVFLMLVIICILIMYVVSCFANVAPFYLKKPDYTISIVLAGIAMFCFILIIVMLIINRIKGTKRKLFIIPLIIMMLSIILSGYLANKEYKYIKDYYDSYNVEMRY